jgi:hypothetical protein
MILFPTIEYDHASSDRPRRWPGGPANRPAPRMSRRQCQSAHTLPTRSVGL